MEPDDFGPKLFLAPACFSFGLARTCAGWPDYQRLTDALNPATAPVGPGFVISFIHVNINNSERRLSLTCHLSVGQCCVRMDTPPVLLTGTVCFNVPPLNQSNTILFLIAAFAICVLSHCDVALN